MFYAHFVLSKRGPLAKVWLAAHWDKKLTKTHVFETDVEKTVDDIISPKVKLALRTSGHLLLGVVRIYSRKQKYLIQDLGEACAKIKMAFRPDVVDLPLESVVAVGDTITLPEIFQNFELAVADLGGSDNMEEDLMRHQSRAEDITLRDDVGSSGMFTLRYDDFNMGSMNNDEFGGMLVDDLEVIREGNSLQDSSNIDSMILPLAGNDSTSLMEENGSRLMDKRNMGDDFNIGIDDFGREGFQDDLIADIPQVENMETGEGHQREQPLEGEPMEVDKSFVPLANETQREDDGFILEPLNTPDVKSHHKRKRKLVIDTKKELASNFIRSQLQDPSDTLRPKIFPPPNKKALMWKEASYSADQMFKIPLIQNCAQPLTDLIIRNFYYPTESSGASSGVAVVEEPPQEVPENLPENELIVHPVDDGVPDIGNMGGQLMDILDEIGDEPENVQPVDVGMNEEEPSKIIPELLGVNGADNEVQREEESGIGDSDVVEDKGEKRWNKRTQQVMKILDKCFAERDEVNFNDITKKCTRKQAASRFYSCLLLAKEGAVKFKQEAPYTDIIIKHT